MPKLIVNPSSPARRDIPLPRTLLSIGRDPSNDLVLPDAMVSRRHAVIECRSGQYFLRDCNSSNGSLVNGDRISERNMRDGDLVAIGAARLLFREEPEAVDGTSKVVQHPSAPSLNCPTCKADYRRGDVFCRQCGGRVREEQAKALCTSCGTAVPLPAHFCNACGATLEDEDASEGATRSRRRDGAEDSQPPRDEAATAPVPVVSQGVREGGPPAPLARAAGGRGSAARVVAPRPSPHAVDRAQGTPRVSSSRTTRVAPRGVPPWHRLAAALVDEVLVAVGLLLLLSPMLLWRTTLSKGSLGEGPDFLPILVSVLLVSVSALWGVFYHAYFWGVKGTTPGKHIFGLRVEGVDGTFPVGLSRALLRFVGYLLSAAAFGIGFVSIAFGGVGLHDRLAGTMVVSDEERD